MSWFVEIYIFKYELVKSIYNQNNLSIFLKQKV